MQAQGTVDPSIGYILHVRSVALRGKVLSPQPPRVPCCSTRVCLHDTALAYCPRRLRMCVCLCPPHSARQRCLSGRARRCRA